MSEIVNKVAQSGLITIDLETFVDQSNLAEIDLKDQLWQELALKEKDFRAWIKEEDWTKFKDKHVCVFCSADAIIPSWAFMLVASKLHGVSNSVHVGSREAMLTTLFRQAIEDKDMREFEGARIMVKGCSDAFVPETAYVDLLSRLQDVAVSIMFGEPCGAVPVWKRPK